ncbi:polyprenyl synthetase family protein [Eilatimonas milleporae]|uniref:Octaprenyl diphosphate synthase n=1 Tax=Eilatimonas milleporae TaxID=911205 RepID=A0A3M0CQP7_9PROT|nr:polyprenyl synthetase family protein [Eilatimonas milleporae]RMB11874.1 octaprenyl-diphosphate synthase [Eilatimonas milleporae]
MRGLSPAASAAEKHSATAATRQDGKPSGPSAMDRLQALVADDMAAVNACILDRMQSPVALIPQLAGHLVSSGGKRLRPVLTLACAQLIGFEGRRHIKLAACVEFIHTATLLHDDVVDASTLRRGRETANEIWGNQASVLVGDFLFSRAFELMVEDGSLDVLRILSAASSVIAEGEVLQLTTTGDLATDEATYLDVIGAKTAVLFAAACEIAGVVADGDDDTRARLRSFGQALGIAFQIVDDVLDYSARQATLGKTVGDDFQEGKLTLPVIYALAGADAPEKAFWKRCLEDLDQRDGDLEQALSLMGRHDALPRAMDRARDYVRDAHAAIAPFADGPMKQALSDIVDFVIERGH